MCGFNKLDIDETFSLQGGEPAHSVSSSVGILQPADQPSALVSQWREKMEKLDKKEKKEREL